MIYKYNRMSLGVILLIFFSVLFGFTLGLRASQFLILDPPGSVGHIVLSCSSKHWLTTSSTSLLAHYILKAGHIVNRASPPAISFPMLHSMLKGKETRI